MNPLIQFKMTILLLLVTFALGFALAPSAQATDTDGALPNGNNADGIGVLTSLTTGVWNSGFGFEALNQDTTGSLNTATGLRALFNNTEGTANTASGMMALFSNTTGANNVAVGAQALVFNTDGRGNTAVGTQALSSNTTGLGNTAVGYQALFSNRTISGNFGVDNTANGRIALFSNTTGAFNTANGSAALFSNTIGAFNTANGSGALLFNETGDNNTAIGFQAGLAIDGSGNVCIGRGIVGESGVNDTTYIRNVGSTAQPVGGTVFGVTVDNTTGKLGFQPSSGRYKEDIKAMDKTSETLFALKPVTFRYKKQIDPKQQLDYGLIAEDVAKVNPELAIRNGKGEIESVRYSAINAMLLNEFLKEHRKNEEQEATIARQQKQIEALTAGLQKVSAQLEVSKPAPQTVLNNQ